MTVQNHSEGLEGYHLNVGDTQSLMHMREWQGTSGPIESWVARICSAAISHGVNVQVECGPEASRRAR
jgi:hypothetical protein